MNGKNNEYAYLAYLTEPRQVGESTKRSPQHLTLVPPFPLESQTIPLVKDVVHRVAADTKPFNISIQKEAKFGPSKKIDVRLIQPKDVVSMLHIRLMAELESTGVSLSHKYVYDEFLPHITVKPAHQNQLPIGQTLTVDHIAIMQKTKGHRTLLAREVLTG